MKAEAIAIVVVACLLFILYLFGGCCLWTRKRTEQRLSETLLHLVKEMKKSMREEEAQAQADEEAEEKERREKKEKKERREKEERERKHQSPCVTPPGHEKGKVSDILQQQPQQQQGENGNTSVPASTAGSRTSVLPNACCETTVPDSEEKEKDRDNVIQVERCKDSKEKEGGGDAAKQQSTPGSVSKNLFSHTHSNPPSAPPSPTNSGGYTVVNVRPGPSASSSTHKLFTATNMSPRSGSPSSNRQLSNHQLTNQQQSSSHQLTNQQQPTNQQTADSNDPEKSGVPSVARLIAHRRRHSRQARHTHNNHNTNPGSHLSSPGASPPLSSTNVSMHSIDDMTTDRTTGTQSITSPHTPKPVADSGTHAPQSEEMVAQLLEKHRKRVVITLLAFCVLGGIVSLILIGVGSNMAAGTSSDARDMADKQRRVFDYKTARETQGMSSVMNALAGDYSHWHALFLVASARCDSEMHELRDLFSENDVVLRALQQVANIQTSLTAYEQQCFSGYVSSGPCTLVYMNTQYQAFAATVQTSMDGIADAARADADDMISDASRSAIFSEVGAFILMVLTAVQFWVVRASFKELICLQVVASAHVSWTLPQVSCVCVSVCGCRRMSCSCS